MSDNYCYRCVVDTDGNFVVFVLCDIFTSEDGNATETPQGYALQDGETLLNAPTPEKLPSRWTGAEWLFAGEDVTPAPQPEGYISDSEALRIIFGGGIND